VTLSFDEAHAYLMSTIGETDSPRTSYKLDRIVAFLRELDDPHLAYPTIHIGGTSGKGSTSTMVAAALTAAGVRAGLHTKPHLNDVTERAKIDGTAIGRERLAALLGQMMPAIERTIAAGYGRPTYYETLLALAFAYFAEERVGAAVIEVGLGGRLDGTNVVAPEVAAITSVGLDHTDVLGDSIEAIAREKGGIAKSGVPLVVADVPVAAMREIEECATQAGARVVRVSDHARVENVRLESARQAFDVVTARERYLLRTPALGAFQRINAATAIVTLEQLRNIRVGRDAVEAAFEALAVAGRMETYPGTPAVVFDIAHNAEKAEHLVSSLREAFTGRTHFVVAIGEGKDARQILATLTALPGTFTFTAFNTAGRSAIEPSQLLEIGRSLGISGRMVSDPVEAFAAARRNAAAGDTVVVTGSTFVVATLRRWFAEQLARVS
jgi:dihydrofolate synthase/folylpolyglutamate synthase